MPSQIILPIILMIVSISALIYMKKYYRKKKKLEIQSDDEEVKNRQTANDFINVKDIRGNYLYTTDNQVISYFQITPISIELFSKREKNNLVRLLTSSISAVKHSFKFLAVSRPVDIGPLLSELSEDLQYAEPKQKELLKYEINEMGYFALSGEVVERQYYIMMWEKVGFESELNSKIKELTLAFSENSIEVNILNEQEIVRLCNLINNPEHVHIEDTGFEASIPLLAGLIQE